LQRGRRRKGGLRIRVRIADARSGHLTIGDNHYQHYHNYYYYYYHYYYHYCCCCCYNNYYCYVLFQLRPDDAESVEEGGH